VVAPFDNPVKPVKVPPVSAEIIPTGAEVVDAVNA
jgi:hypothetical protein